MKKKKSRSDKNHKRGQYRCPECGWSAHTLQELMDHKLAEKHK